MEIEADSLLLRQLRREILLARERVYRAAAATPLEQVSTAGGCEIFVKREDVSPIKAYKWRGAFNRMAVLEASEKQRGVVTASAGNHAQGVALAACQLGVDALIFMPRTTPQVKQDAVRRLGGTAVTIRLVGDSYDDASSAAHAEVGNSGRIYVHAYDDLHVIAGQATLADEVVMSGQGPFDVAYLQIGGGGMAAGVATWLRLFYPGIRIIGVEGEDQASMRAAMRAGEPVRLNDLDIFCDGTAVRQAGELPFAICREVIDEYITVTNGEVGGAIRFLWDRLRCLSEPAGAMGLAGALQQEDQLKGKRVLTVLCGANIDFIRLGSIALAAGLGGRHRALFRVGIPERPGTMLQLLDGCFKELNIVAFQYGKNHPDEAWPVFGLAGSEREIRALEERFTAAGYPYERIGSDDEIRYRLIPLRPELLNNVLFLDLEFYERPGALHAFLTEAIRDRASFCYFNYLHSGERVGRALIGLEFEDSGNRAAFLDSLPPQGAGYRSCRPMPESALQRFLGYA